MGAIPQDGRDEEQAGVKKLRQTLRGDVMRKGVWGTEQKRKREGVDGWGRALCVAEEEGRDGEEWGKTELEISKFGLGRGMGGGKSFY